MEKEKQPQITIREATFDDLLAIRTMHARSWLDTYPNDEAGVSEEWVAERVSKWTTPEGIENSKEHFKDKFGNPDHFYRIALNGEEVVGLVHGSKLDGEQHLEALYLDRSQHGTGLASTMMEMVDSWFDQSKEVKLEVASYNNRAIRFYEKLGFRIVPGTDSVFAEKIPIIEMKREGVER